MEELEKEELIDEVLSRISEMSEEERKERGRNNTKILRGTSEHFNRKLREYNQKHPYDGCTCHIDSPHAWNAYYQIRKIIPWFISVRYSNEINWDEFYKLNPGAEKRDIHISTPNKMLEEDDGLATAIGQELVDILFKYLEPEAWNEAEAAEKREHKRKRSPLKRVRRI